jgi:hypothetical protein
MLCTNFCTIIEESSKVHIEAHMKWELYVTQSKTRFTTFNADPEYHIIN